MCEFLAASRKLEPYGFGATDAWHYVERLGNAWLMMLVATAAARFRRLRSLPIVTHNGMFSAMMRDKRRAPG